MKTPFIDHSFSKIIEGDYLKSLVMVVVTDKLKQLDKVAEAIQKDSGSDAIESILAYKTVRRALEQCHAFICNGSTDDLTDDDYSIYYEHAYTKLKKAQDIIDATYSHLEL